MTTYCTQRLCENENENVLTLLGYKSGRGSSRSGMRTTSRRFLDRRISFIIAILLYFLVTFFSLACFSGSSDTPASTPRVLSPVLGFP